MASRYPRKTDRGFKDFNALMNAIKCIKIDKKSMKSVATAFSISRTSLHRAVQRFDLAVPDISKVPEEELLEIVKRIGKPYGNTAEAQQVFTPEQEEALVVYIVKCCQHYYGLSINEVKELAFQFAVKMSVPVHPSWKEHRMAGRQWYYGFMLRHTTLSLRTPEQTSLNRVKAFCKENVSHFFQNLSAVLDATPFAPSRIYNMDETGFSTVPTKMGKIVALKGMKRVGQIVSAERGPLITLAFAVNAVGHQVPPFYVFPQKNYSKSYLTHAALEAKGVANGSGWMQAPEFVEFMHHFIKHSHSTLINQTLLLLDNHASHLSVEVIDLALANGVTMLSFPPHCSHRLQPLDVSVFGPVKGKYKAVHNAFMKTIRPNPLQMIHIPKLVGHALLEGALPQNIVRGFAATGICPFNPGVFSDSDFVSLGVDKENEEVAAVEREYGEEEQRRIVIDASQFGVAAHETVSTSDFSESMSLPSTSGTYRATSLSSLLDAIGPLQTTTPQKKSNRGPKPQKATILTSPENVAIIKERAARRSAVKVKKEAAAEKRKQSASPKKKQPPAKKQKKSGEVCLLCNKPMPENINATNSAKCRSCGKCAHRKCLEKPTTYYVCPGCDDNE